MKLLISIFLILGLAGCTVTTGSVDGTSESFENTTGSASHSVEASSESTSSTSPDGDDDDDKGEKNEDGMNEADKEAFLERNKSLILAELSSQPGEYFDAVTDMYAVPKQKRISFFKACQNLSEENLVDSLPALAARL